jgi:hypothetical protein
MSLEQFQAIHHMIQFDWNGRRVFSEAYGPDPAQA